MRGLFRTPEAAAAAIDRLAGRYDFEDFRTRPTTDFAAAVRRVRERPRPVARIIINIFEESAADGE